LVAEPSSLERGVPMKTPRRSRGFGYLVSTPLAVRRAPAGQFGPQQKTQAQRPDVHI
jgi:hypothetical protein